MTALFSMPESAGVGCHAVNSVRARRACNARTPPWGPGTRSTRQPSAPPGTQVRAPGPTSCSGALVIALSVPPGIPLRAGLGVREVPRGTLVDGVGGDLEGDTGEHLLSVFAVAAMMTSRPRRDSGSVSVDRFRSYATTVWPASRSRRAMGAERPPPTA